MQLIYLCFTILLLHEVNAGVARKPPAFASPVYSDSYLPAAMQVIFYAVEQLKTFQMEEAELASSTTVPTTSPHAPGQHQPTSTTPLNKPEVMMMMQTEKPIEMPSPGQEAVVAETEKPIISTTAPADQKPEVFDETPEAVYGTPETNHETPEASQEVQESNQENQVTPVPQEKPTVEPSDELVSSTVLTTSPTSQSPEVEKKKKEPTIDSVVQEIYGIVKPQNKSRGSSEESDESKDFGESKSEDDEDEDEEYDENRFTLLGEKVTQVPRPSLSTYLRKAKIPPRCSLQQLALLYDSLSKDARKQGFAKFSGYSDDVLKTLETSAEGGIGPQLQKLLEKTIERNELTRDDTRARTMATLKELKDPGSTINRDLRRLVPLSFKL